MGFFGKLKNILFEDDEEDETGGMPVYTKEDVSETPKKVETKKDFLDDEPIRPVEGSRFRNVKRDIDLNFDESDVLGEVPGHQNVVTTKSEPAAETPELPVKKEEKKSPFLSFDEDEFERLNSRVNRNENRVINKVKSVGTPVSTRNTNVASTNTARKANNNFSSTSTGRDTKYENTDRYKINSGTLGNGKKPFTPSPVISPVYGILDKNYRKDDIVDKQGGMKREKIVKPVSTKLEEDKTINTTKKSTTLYEVDIDSVRKKAYGELEELENTLTSIALPALEEKQEERIEPVVEIQEDVSLPIEEKPSIEEQLDEKYDVSDIKAEDLMNTNDLDKVVEEVIEEKKPIKKEKNSKLLDELEKTSTLQILDDIEKELNSIKPIVKKEEEVEEEQLRDRSDDTLENDLFHLIDSMYQEGEEEEEDD